jgi:hypothetical protein
MAEKQRGSHWAFSAFLIVFSSTIMGLMMWHYITPVAGAILWVLLVVGRGAYVWRRMGPLNPRRDDLESGSV